MYLLAELLFNMMLIIVISITIISIVFFLLLVNLPSLYRLLYGKVSIKFSDFIIIVTGCDTGFGAMLALALHQIGYFVIATTLTKEGDTDKTINNHILIFSH